MAQIIIQSDDGTEVARYQFPASSSYALAYMPPCLVNTRIHDLLNGMRRALGDACSIDETGRPLPERPSEQVMRLLRHPEVRSTATVEEVEG